MRIWTLSAGDPLQLSLAADARLGPTDYPNDIVWELNFGRGEPAALAVQTNFGLRARWMQFFPVFTRAGVSVVDPKDFHRAPQLTHFYPNYLDVSFAPFEGVEARAEYRICSSQVLAGRLRLTNKSVLPHNLRLDWAAILNPLGYGEGMAALPMGLGTALQGHTDGLSLVCFMTGGPQANRGTFPGLSLPVELYPGASAEIFWAVAARPQAEDAFALAQAACERPWDAEVARIEVRNAADVLEITTGDPEWNATLALSQRVALGLLMSNPERLPAPSFVLNRRIDQGASARGDGSDHPYLWAGQTALDSWYLASLLPGAQGLAEGLLRNFLAACEQGQPDFRPGLGGQRTRYLAQPLLASLALLGSSTEFLETAYPTLLGFFKAWLNEQHDRDGDGLPEWEHPVQTGLENSPLYDRWNPGAEGMDITRLESPALGAMLYQEARSLVQLAERLGRTDDLPWLEAQAARIHKAVEQTWEKRTHLFRYRDSRSHTSRAGRPLLAFHGPGTHAVRRKMAAATHLVVQLDLAYDNTRTAILTLSGLDAANQPMEEKLAPRDFTWSGRSARATTRQVFVQALRVEATGLAAEDGVRLVAPDFSLEDLSLFLPLWAGIPDADRAKALVEVHLLGRYLQPYGLPLTPGPLPLNAPRELSGVSMLWNAMVGEGLLAAGYRQEAAGLTGRLMRAALLSLKQDYCFRQFYQAANGQGLGERDHLWGLPPVGLFLHCLGVAHLSPREIVVCGFNPFPWPITVKYQRITVMREGDRTSLTLPGRLPLTLTGPEPRRISLG